MHWYTEARLKDEAGGLRGCVMMLGEWCFTITAFNEGEHGTFKRSWTEKQLELEFPQTTLINDFINCTCMFGSHLKCGAGHTADAHGVQKTQP